MSWHTECGISCRSWVMGTNSNLALKLFKKCIVVFYNNLRPILYWNFAITAYLMAFQNFFQALGKELFRVNHNEFDWM